MKVLVTGANGIIGANLVRELLADDHEVCAFVREKSDLRSLNGLGIQIVVGDVLQLETLVSAAEGCDLLFHAAAVFSYWSHAAEELKKIAVEGTVNAVEAAHRAGVRRVVLTSSSVVLGSNTARILRDETDEFNEADAYSIAKAEQEKAGFARAEKIGIDLVAVCPAMSVGPHDYRLSPSNAIICAYLNDPFKVTFPGGINIVSVRDVARGHILVANSGRPGRRYVLGSENLEWAALHRMISELCGVPGPHLHANHTTSYLAATAVEMLAMLTGKTPLSTRAQAKMVGRYYWYRHTRAAKLGYAPRPAREALADAIGWLLSTSHIPMTLRGTLTISPEVYDAWRVHEKDELRYQKNKVGAHSAHPRENQNAYGSKTSKGTCLDHDSRPFAGNRPAAR
jgi:dihydroflavonol-4-reductase